MPGGRIVVTLHSLPLRLRMPCVSRCRQIIFKDGQIAARHVGVTPEATLRAEMQKLSKR
jgi:hypothetical protein